MDSFRGGPTPPPEFGPSGYLPERASKRARKIVLRAPMGLQWVVASVLAGVLVLVAGGLFLLRSGHPPTEPWVPVGPVDEIGDARHEQDLGVLLVGAGGRVRAFSDAQGVVYCPGTHRLESADGRVWNLTGRGFSGVESLEEHPTLVQDGEVYVDPSRATPGQASSQQAAQPGCD